MKAPPADVRLLSTPTSILILGPSSAFGMPDLKPVSVLGTFELGPNDRHAFGVLQSIRSDNYEMTKAQDYLGQMTGETYTISNTALNRDTILGLHSHLQSGKSQMIVVDRYYRHTTAFAAYAKSGTGHVPLAHPRQPTAKAAANPKLPVLQAAPAAQAIPPPANVGSWSVEQRLKLLFEDMLPLLGQDLRAYVQSMLTGKALASLVAGVVVMAGLQAIPGVGEIADAAFLGVVWIYAGWDGLRAVPVLVKAVRYAASATTTGEIEAAAPDAARALETLGGDVLAILIARAAKRNTSGGGTSSAGEADPLPQVVNSNRGQGIKASSRPRLEPVPSNSALGETVGRYSAIEPGPLPDNLAETFSGGRYDVVKLKEDTVLYRAGTADKPLGQFFSADPPTSVLQTRVDKAILPVWPGGMTSPLDTVFAVKIPAGTPVYVGDVGTQSGFYVGGTQQIVVVTPWKIDGVNVMGSNPLK